MWTFRPRRVALSANVATAVSPPNACTQVLIGNATADDLKVYEDPNDETTYFVVAAGYEKQIKLPNHRFDPTSVAFYLKAAQAGTAVIIWL
jgi:hypothetical protein